jgi:uncharacterized SAM-binding protein YcdF (DUF218 family)
MELLIFIVIFKVFIIWLCLACLVKDVLLLSMHTPSLFPLIPPLAVIPCLVLSPMGLSSFHLQFYFSPLKFQLPPGLVLSVGSTMLSSSSSSRSDEAITHKPKFNIRHTTTYNNEAMTHKP